MQLQIYYKKCPNCGKWYTYYEMISYTIHGNTECWSDGKCNNMPFSEYSNLAYDKCSACNQFFWNDDCEMIEEYMIREYLNKGTIEKNENLVLDFLSKNKNYESNDNDLSNDYPPASYWDNMEQFMLDDYKILLNSKSSQNIKREIYIRIKIWQTINNYVRDNRNPIAEHFKYNKGLSALCRFSFLKELFATRKKNIETYKLLNEYRRENLERLLHLIDESEKLPHEIGDETEYITQRIEIYRELAKFSEALELLKSAEKELMHHNISFVKKTRKHISRKSTLVFQL